MTAATAAALIAFAACSAITGDDPDSPEIRIRNATSLRFDSVRVLFPKDSEQYGVLPAGGTSDYHEVKEAYSYAYVAAYSGGTKYILQPIDYVGESLLRAGRYTYALKLSGPGQTELWSDLIVDDD